MITSSRERAEINPTPWRIVYLGRFGLALPKSSFNFFTKEHVLFATTALFLPTIYSLFCKDEKIQTLPVVGLSAA